MLFLCRGWPKRFATKLPSLAIGCFFDEIYYQVLLFQYLFYNENMKNQEATAIFESLSSGVRLDIYRLLVKKGTQGLVAGEIATALDLPPTNLSFHFRAMTQTGLLTVEQEGRFQRYRANIPLMLDLIAYLTEECCAGHPETCAELRAASTCPDALLPPLPVTQRQD